MTGCFTSSAKADLPSTHSRHSFNSRYKWLIYPFWVPDFKEDISSLKCSLHHISNRHHKALDSDTQGCVALFSVHWVGSFLSLSISELPETYESILLLFFFFFLDVFSLWSNSRVDSLEVPFHRSQKHKRRSFLSLLDHYPESSSRLPSLQGIEMEKEVGPDVIQTWGWRKSSVFMPLESASVRPLNPCEQWRFCSLRKFWIFSSC